MTGGSRCVHGAAKMEIEKQLIEIESRLWTNDAD